MGVGFVQALRAHSREVQELQGEQAAEFLRFLKDERERLYGRLLSGARPDAGFDAFRLSEVLARTETAIQTLEQKATGIYQVGTKEAAELSIEHIGDELKRMSLAFDAKPLNVAIDAQAVLADPTQGLLANHFQSSVRRYGLDVLNSTRRELFLGLRDTQTFGQIVESIAGLKGPFGEVGRSAGERLVRTEVSQAYGAAHHQGFAQAQKQDPALRPVWLHVASYLCKVCGPLHGTQAVKGTWTIRQGRKVKQVAHPPAHPNCTCRLSVMKPSWRRGLERLGYLKEQSATDEAGSAPL